jgi:hypothetical protein
MVHISLVLSYERLPAATIFGGIEMTPVGSEMLKQVICLISVMGEIAQFFRWMICSVVGRQQRGYSAKLLLYFGCIVYPMRSESERIRGKRGEYHGRGMFLHMTFSENFSPQFFASPDQSEKMPAGKGWWLLITVIFQSKKVKTKSVSVKNYRDYYEWFLRSYLW